MRYGNCVTTTNLNDVLISLRFHTIVCTSMCWPLMENARMNEPEIKPSSDDDDIGPLITERMRDGLELFWRAAKYAMNAGLDRWDFAVDVDEVRNAGLGPTDLRWLIAKGYVDHARETDANAHEHRSFEAQHRFRFKPDSCFVLTELGVAFVRIGLLEPLRAVAAGPDLADPTAAPEVQANHQAPRWDLLRRELWVGKVLVKQYRVPAPRQEMVLTVFQEENWPPRIDDPLPPQTAIDPKRQLHATISSLNRSQKQALIQFRGDGSGTGVLWELNLGDRPVEEKGREDDVATE
jgi:hypothetical protein